MNTKVKKSFTLVELLITIAISTFILYALHTSYITGNRAWKTYDSRVNTQRQTRQALTYMAKELREASGVAIVQNANSSTLSFSRDGVGAISYAWSNSGNDANEIIRTLGATPKILATDISSLSFTDNTGSITIDLTSTKTTPARETITFTMREKVAMR